MKDTSTFLLLLFTLLFCNIASGSTLDHIGHETSYRHDQWHTGEWVPYDSGYSVRDAQLNPVGYTYFNYANNAWTPVFTSNSSFNSANKVLNYLTKYWNSAAGSFQNTYYGVYTYNGANLPLTQTYQDWVNNAWRDHQVISYTYDGNNNRTVYLIQYWDTASNALVNSVKYLDTYDGASNQLSELDLLWRTTGSGYWDTSSLNTKTYDANHHILVQISAAWSAGVLNSLGRTTNTYDGTGNLTTQVYENSYDGVVWKNYTKSEFTYDANNNKTQETSTVWNLTTSQWDNFAIRTYTYDANNRQVSYHQQTWNSTTHAYVNSAGSIYGYDSYGNANLYETISWNSTDGWYVTFKDSSVYDANANLLYEIGLTYDLSSHQFINHSRSTYWYGTGVGIRELDGELNAALYPNPSDGKNISLQLDLEQDAELAINLYDVSGRIVNTENRFAARNEKLQLHYPALSAGTYLLQLLDRGIGKSRIIRLVVK